MSYVWPFDQAPRVAAITTCGVLDDGLPILRVVHYLADEDWAFTCGTTDDAADIRVVAMEEALALDATLVQIADLPPGWGASRPTSGGQWVRYKLPDERGRGHTLAGRIAKFFRSQ
jgi:hypothetical protein